MLGFPQLLQAAAASRSGARGGLRVGCRGSSCALQAAAGRGVGCAAASVPRAGPRRPAQPPAEAGGASWAAPEVGGVTAGRAAAVRGLHARAARGPRVPSLSEMGTCGPRVGGSGGRSSVGGTWRRTSQILPLSPVSPSGLSWGRPSKARDAASAPLFRPRQANGRRRRDSQRGRARGGPVSSPGQPKSRGGARGS